VIEQADHGQVASEKVLDAAQCRIAGILGFAEGLPRPAREARGEPFPISLYGLRVKPEAEIGLLAALPRPCRERHKPFGLNQIVSLANDHQLPGLHTEPTGRVIPIPFTGVAFPTRQLDDLAHFLERHLQSPAPKLVYHVASLLWSLDFGVQGVVDSQTHVVIFLFRSVIAERNADPVSSPSVSRIGP
jgi:hypothetical protein